VAGSVSVVIPFHNEAGNIDLLIPSLREILDRCAGRRIEVLLVDDASTDDSLARAQKLAGDDNRIRILNLPFRGGQTGAFRLGFAEAQNEFIIRMDADLQDNPADLPLFFEKIDEGYDLVIGGRNLRKHIWLLRFASAVYDLLVRALFTTGLQFNSGSFVAFRTSLVKDIPFESNDHRYIPLIAIRRGAEKRCNVFLAHRKRVHGKTKYPTVRKVFFGMFEIFRFYFRCIAGSYDLRRKVASRETSQQTQQ
jgi:glycosyltransferase involved in cell wall biosynthesis